VRIIAGSARGRRLAVPRGDAVRPTADRVRETIFNVLGQWLDGERVLDLYAGTGSLGLEALSRGAAHAVFVERDRDTAAVLSQNIRALGFGPATTVLLQPADRALRRLAGEEKFTLVFADAPYAAATVASLLVPVAAVLRTGGRAVLEHGRREAVPEREGALVRWDERRFGDTVASFYRLDPVFPGPAGEIP